MLICHSNIQSHVNCALSVWGRYDEGYWLEADKKNQQNRLKQLIFDAGGRTRLSGLYRKANILRIEDLIELSLLRYMFETLPQRIHFNFIQHRYLWLLCIHKIKIILAHLTILLIYTIRVTWVESHICVYISLTQLRIEIL